MKRIDESKSIFETLFGINVNDHIEKKKRFNLSFRGRMPGLK